mmetsp:Transcript_25620/g.57473  ORF Transcript_25620/g.57473 Transcript_25620/m.57473 type:complete len:246 (-) Transcript_25620:259-996(-)
MSKKKLRGIDFVSLGGGDNPESAVDLVSPLADVLVLAERVAPARAVEGEHLGEGLRELRGHLLVAQLRRVHLGRRALRDLALAARAAAPHSRHPGAAQRGQGPAEVEEPNLHHALAGLAHDLGQGRVEGRPIVAHLRGRPRPARIQQARHHHPRPWELPVQPRQQLGVGPFHLAARPLGLHVGRPEHEQDHVRRVPRPPHGRSHRVAVLGDGEPRPGLVPGRLGVALLRRCEGAHRLDLRARELA